MDRHFYGNFLFGVPCLETTRDDYLSHYVKFKVLLDRFSPGLSARFNIKSILTLVVENTFSEMRTGASDMPLQLEFDYRFSRAIKERLKRQCSTPYSYFTSSSSYYPHTFVSASYSDLPKLRPQRQTS